MVMFLYPAPCNRWSLTLLDHFLLQKPNMCFVCYIDGTGPQFFGYMGMAAAVVFCSKNTNNYEYFDNVEERD